MKGAGVGDYLAPGAVHIGDVRELAGRLEPLSIQCIISSPPYFGLRSYLPADHPDKAHELGSESTPEEFVANLVAVFAALRPALKDDGTVWLNLGDSYANDTKWGGATGGKHAAGVHGATGIGRAKVSTGVLPKSLLMIPHRVALALQADGWVIRQDNVWAKVNPMPESVTDRTTRAHEYVFHIAKNPTYYHDAEAIKEPQSEGTFLRFGNGKAPRKTNPKAIEAEYGRVLANSRFKDATPDAILPNGRNKRSVWSVPGAQFPGAHFATFSPDLIRPCILAGTSARGECAACGQAWVRCVEREDVERGVPRTPTGRPDKPYGTVPGSNTRGVPFRAVVGESWRPQCSCPPGTPTRPQLVLDPFAGSCTTWEVAHEEGRRFVGFDLDERAVEWGRQRLAKLPVGRLFA